MTTGAEESTADSQLANSNYIKGHSSICWPSCVLSHLHPKLSIMAAPIVFRLFRKGTRFYCTTACQAAMDFLKLAVSEAPALISVDYSPSAGPIDASTIGWGAGYRKTQEEITHLICRRWAPFRMRMKARNASSTGS